MAAVGVGLGAYGAHGLRGRLETTLQTEASEDSPNQNADRDDGKEKVDRRVDQFNTGVRYHLYHVLAMIVLARWIHPGGRGFQVAAWMMAAGTFFFSGSLYILVFADLPIMGAITPIGGVLWILAWIIVAVAASKIDADRATLATLNRFRFDDQPVRAEGETVTHDSQSANADE